MIDLKGIPADWFKIQLCPSIGLSRLWALDRARSQESLTEGHNWFLNQSAEIFGDLSLSTSYLFWQKPGYASHHLRSAVHDHRLRKLYVNNSINLQLFPRVTVAYFAGIA